MKTNSSNTIIITGDVHQGKTTFATEVAKILRSEKLELHGFLSPGTFIFGIRNSFSLVDLHTGAKMDLSTTTARKDWQKFKRFYFNPDALMWGNQLLKSVPNQPSVITFVDEAGVFELEGDGWRNGIVDLLKKENPVKVLVIRTKFVNKIIDHFALNQPHIYSLSGNTPQDVAGAIVSLAKID